MIKLWGTNRFVMNAPEQNVLNTTVLPQVGYRLELSQLFYTYNTQANHLHILVCTGSGQIFRIRNLSVS